MMFVHEHMSHFVAIALTTPSSLGLPPPHRFWQCSDIKITRGEFQMLVLVAGTQAGILKAGEKPSSG